MNAEFYTNTILDQAYLPSVRELCPEGCRMWADNDPKHTSRLASGYLQDHNLPWFRSPAESPDLNPIELVWYAMKYRVAKAKVTTKDELKAAILKAWDEHLTVELCNKYIDHIPKVLQKVCEANGGYTGC